MSTIAAVSAVLPEHHYAQGELTESMCRLIGLPEAQLPVLRRLHANSGVEHRYLALPVEDYPGVTADFGSANDAFIVAATELAHRAVQKALDLAHLTPQDVDLMVSTTITGVAVPSIEARLMALMPMRSDVRRVPIIGLGCLGGAAGIARVDDYLVGHPDEVAVLVSVEVCSLTLQRGDTSMANLIASGLFGDGAAAVVMVGEAAGAQHPARPSVVASRSRFYPDTHEAMGWDVGSTGLTIVLGAEVPDLVRGHVQDDVDAFLGGHGLTRADIGWWVAHPGGPKVIAALLEALEVDPDALLMTTRSLARVGNLSSSSVLHVLDDTLRERPPAPGTYGLLMAMGPGFCLETVLLRMPEA